MDVPLVSIVRFERAPTRDHLVYHAPECEDIAAGISALTFYLLRSHILRCTQHHSRPGERISDRVFARPGLNRLHASEPEVEQFDPAV
jgi:hypothetical protein